MANIIDFNSESNYNALGALDIVGAALGSSFTGDGSRLDSVKVYLIKSSSPTGNTYVDIYAHTGSYGSTGTPTGSALARSDAVVASTFTSLALYTFTYSGSNRIILQNGVNYCLSVTYDGDATNKVLVGYDSSGTHSGNKFYYFGGWNAQAAEDLVFYVYGESDKVSKNMYLKQGFQ